MGLSKQEIQKALRVSRLIQEYIEMVRTSNLNSNDVTDYLERKQMFPSHPQKGFYLRQFLHKLRKEGYLDSLIPQAKYQNPVGSELLGSWSFNDAKASMPKVIRVKIDETKKEEDEPMNFRIAEEIVQLLIEGINPISNNELDANDACMNPRIQEALHYLISENAYQIETPTLLVDSDVKVEKDLSKIEKLKDEVNSWKIIKKTDELPEFKRKVRIKYPRAFEIWSAREKEILTEAIEILEDKQTVADILKRSPHSVEIMLDSLT